MKTALLFLLCATPAWAVPATITVLNADQKPVPDATVQLESFGEPGGILLGTTDATGQTRFEIKPRAIYPRFLGRVVVWKAGYALGGGNPRARRGAGANAVRATAKSLRRTGGADGLGRR